MTLFSLDPAYVPLIQKPMCCAVTCLQMILYRNGYGLFDQEQLAVDFGVHIAPQYSNAFSSNMPISISANDDEGISTVNSIELINVFLEKYAPNLVGTAFLFSDITSLPDFLIANIIANNDIWIEYHGHQIHHTDQFAGNYIHDGLIESFDSLTTICTLIDPVPEHRQRIGVTVADISESISTCFGRETGFIIVKKKPV